MKKTNIKHLILLILLFSLFLGITVSANEWTPLIETQEGEVNPIGSVYTIGVYFPWRHSDGGDGTWRYLKPDGSSSYWSGIKDKDFLEMVRGEKDPSRIYNLPYITRTWDLHPNVVKYLDNGGDINSIKIRYKSQMVSEGQGVHEWVIPEGDIYKPEMIFYKTPEYSIDLANRKISMRYVGKLAPPFRDAFYGPNDDSKMLNTVLTADDNYGFNGFSMWGHNGSSGHKGSASSEGRYDIQKVAHPLTKDLILNSGGYVNSNTTLTNVENYPNTFNSNNVRIGTGTFSNGGAIGYATRQPILVEFYIEDGNNIRIGSDKNKIGDNYNAKVIDLETNTVLNPETDKLVLGKKYKFDYHLAYTSSKDDKVKTNNSPIITNIYHFYNGATEHTKYFENIKDTKNLPFLEMVNKAGENLNFEKYEQDKMDLSKLANYQHEFEIEQLDKNGKKVEKVKLCANLPWQHSFYKSFNGDEALGDNDNRADDDACLEFQVDNNLANTMVAHSANNVSFNNYDKLEVRKNNQLISSDGGEVMAGDNLQLRAYVKRSDLPPTPAGNDNPVLVRDVSLVLNETINEQVKAINQRETNTIYKAGFTRLKPQIASISFRNENGTQGAFTKYNASTHGAQKFEAGTILIFEMEYKVPEQNELFGERSTKYNGYYAPVSKALTKMALSFDLSFNNRDSGKVNAILTDDWTKAILNVSGNKRNMEITEVIVKDENGSTVRPANPNNDLLVFKSDKNYYFEPKILYSYIQNQSSINQNLKAEVYVVYDDIPPTITNQAESERKSYWRHGDVGTYSLNQQPTKVNNVSTYYPNSGNYEHVAKAIRSKPDNVSVSAFNPLMIPIKYLNVSSGTIIVKIPSTYNNNDNEMQAGTQIVQIPFVVEGAIDNSVKITKFYDKNNKDVGVSVDGVCVGIDPTASYTLEFEVKREFGTGDLTKFPNDKVKSYYDVNGKPGTSFTPIIVPEKSTQRNGSYVLEKPGDKITYRVSNLSGANGKIDLTALFEHIDVDMSNNQDFGCWEGKFNLSITGFNINPSTADLTLPNPEKPTRTEPIKLSFTAEIGFEDTLADEYKKDFDYSDLKVPIEIREFLNGRATGNVYFFTDGVKYSELPINAGPDGFYATTISAEFEKKITFTEAGQYAYQISVNGGDQGSPHRYRKYNEINPHLNNPYEDNVAVANFEVKVWCKDQDCPPPNITYLNGGTYNWSETFYSRSSLGTAEYYDVTVCDESGNCWEEERCRCINVSPIAPGFDGTEHTIPFYESYRIDIFVQTINRPTWTRANGQTIPIRAGQWFDIKIVSTYDQNRFPCRGKYEVPLCNGGGCDSCHSTSTRHATPGNNYIIGEQSMFIQTRAFGKTENYWFSKPNRGPVSTYYIPNKRNSDSSGQTSTRKYVSTHAPDGKYEVIVKNMPFDNLAKWSPDENHPAKGSDRMQVEYDRIPGLLCNGQDKNCPRYIITSPGQFAQSETITIEIKNQLNIKTQIIGN